MQQSLRRGRQTSWMVSCAPELVVLDGPCAGFDGHDPQCHSVLRFLLLCLLHQADQIVVEPLRRPCRSMCCFACLSALQRSNVFPVSGLKTMTCQVRLETSSLHPKACICPDLRCMSLITGGTPWLSFPIICCFAEQGMHATSWGKA